MKSVLIIPSWYKNSESPSSGSFFEEQAVLMARSFEVSVLVMERFYIDNINDASYYPPQLSSENNSLQVYRLRFPQSRFLSPDENLKTQIYYGKKGFLDILKECESNFSLIHAQATFPAGIIAKHVSNLTPTPYIITEHFGPFNPDFLHSDFVKREMFSALEQANDVLSVSYHLRQQILMQGIKCNPIVVGNFVDDDLFNVTKRNLESRIRLLTVAYYPSYIKDLDNLFSALVFLKKELIDFHLNIVGGGEPQGGNLGHNMINDIVKNYDLGEEVTVLGSCSRIEMKEQMQYCDIYVSSSIAETFGVCICEAMLCGKPVVLTKNGGSADFASSSNSISVEIHNPEQLANAIIKLIDTYSNYDPISIRNGISNKYGRKAFLNRMCSIYSKYIKCE